MSDEPEPEQETPAEEQAEEPPIDPVEVEEDTYPDEDEEEDEYEIDTEGAIMVVPFSVPAADTRLSGGISVRNDGSLYWIFLL